MRVLIGGTPKKIIQHVGIVAYQDRFGSLASWADGASPTNAIQFGGVWAMDNFAFTRFDPNKFVRYLDKHAGIADSCLWVCAPDVVGDAPRTLERFDFWQHVIRSRGYRVALVAQDGLEHEEIPFDEFDALFIGGSTAWKIGHAAADIAREAKGRDKWVHMGRVNGKRRLRYAEMIGCDSVDGTGYAVYPPKAKEAMQVFSEDIQRPLWEGLRWA